MKGMSEIVKTVTKIIVGVIFIYGLYIIVHGHLTPGGGFAGGAVLAGAFVLLVLAYGSPETKLKSQKEYPAIFESLSLLAFLVLASIGIGLGIKVFFNNYLPKGIVGDLVSAGNIPLYNMAIGIEVAAAMFAIILALIIYKEEARE